MRGKKKQFSKFVVAAVVTLNILFAAAVLFAAVRGAVVPDSLIVSWYGFTTGELWALSSIKKTKVKKEGGADAEH